MVVERNNSIILLFWQKSSVAAKPPYYYLKKGFVSNIADFISVPVAHWRKVKLANLNRPWFIFGWQPYQMWPEPEQQPLEDMKTCNAQKLIRFIMNTSFSKSYNTRKMSRVLDSYSHCQQTWLIFQPANGANAPLCVSIVIRNKPKFGFQCEFQACCLTGTRPSHATLQRMLVRGVYGNICCLLLLGTQRVLVKQK